MLQYLFWWIVLFVCFLLVELIKVLQRGGQTQSGHHMQWFRAVFHNKHNIQAELALARAELKISRQVLDRPTSVSPGVRQGVKVKINGMKLNKAPRRRITPPVASNVTMLDISPEVEKWMRTDGNLVVDVGIAVSRREFPEANPTLSLELGLNKPTRARRTRTPHSNKEDVCNEQGWCCRKSITVSFKDIGWTDWVVAPTEYTMHFCDGTCPHNYKPASMHTQVKSQLHQITKGGIPRPCCVPAAYEPMVLMHYDSRGKLKLTPFDDLIVSKCHCAWGCPNLWESVAARKTCYMIEFYVLSNSIHVIIRHYFILKMKNHVTPA